MVVKKAYRKGSVGIMGSTCVMERFLELRVPLSQMGFRRYGFCRINLHKCLRTRMPTVRSRKILRVFGASSFSEYSMLGTWRGPKTGSQRLPAALRNVIGRPEPKIMCKKQRCRDLNNWSNILHAAGLM